MHGSMPPTGFTASETGTTAPEKRQALLVLICTSAPSFMLQLDANIVSVSLPAIGHSLNASFAGIEWVITAYMLSFASFLMPAGDTGTQPPPYEFRSSVRACRWKCLWSISRKFSIRWTFFESSPAFAFKICTTRCCAMVGRSVAHN